MPIWEQNLLSNDSDWILTTSASCLIGESKTAKKILQELFKKHYEKMAEKHNKIKRQNTVTVTFENNERQQKSKPAEELEEDDGNSPKPDNDLIVAKKILCNYPFENFDESQHLNGCPVKWLYNKKLLDKNKRYNATRLCSKKSAKTENIPKEKCKNVRDKTPIEVKIHKINLTEKYTGSSDDYFPPFKPPLMEKSEFDTDVIECHRKKLAAKLNCKLHDDSQDGSQVETSSEISSRQNYLPPRPLMGLKPLLSILLSPQQATTCCSIAAHLQASAIATEKRMPSPSLSINSLDLPFFTTNKVLRPKTTNTPRWGSKTSRIQKKLQIPNQITINLRQHQKQAITKPEETCKSNNPPVKKINERTKQVKHPRSLSSLFYELSDKTNYRNHNQKYFEDILRDLTMEDEQFNIKRFLHFNYMPGNADPEKMQKRLEEKKSKSVDSDVAKNCWNSDPLNLVCGRVKFFEKYPDTKIMKQENLRRRSVRVSSLSGC